MTTNIKLINLLLMITNMKNEILLVILEIILLSLILPYIVLGLLQITNINIIIQKGENRMSRTLEGTKIKRQHVSGFIARMATPGGQDVIKRRRAKGRHNLGIVGKKTA